MKNLFSCIIFCTIVILLFITINGILVPKSANSYYILEKDYKGKENEFDVLVFGSCHAYTSFNPIYLEKKYNMSAYVLGNAGEIIPTTYVRMKEQFENYIPKYAIVEVWGINPYDTYDTTEKILGNYLKNNVERLPMSLDKLELINDFNLDVLEMHCAVSKYKDRILNEDLEDADFNYSFEKTLNGEESTEMSIRLANNGFKLNPSYDVTHFFENYTYSTKNSGYLEIEPIIVKYLIKIIELCKEYNVPLIFYRVPYLSNENELKKLNHLEDICNAYNIPFIDLEQEIVYEYTKDFNDGYHLCEIGANKSTDYLANYILETY